MIPVRLHLHNFLSYGDTSEPIELDGIHVACLCGPNGHGKSALLDAITWALWGQARSNASADLIRLNQPGMFVDLEFLLDSQPYRVVRKWNRSRAGQSDLQFQTRDEEGGWRALTGQGVRGTQERINAVLRMDYETFINSAFLLQGRADEFARKTPGDRKKILGEILNLRIYDALSEAARTRMREAQMRVSNLDADIARLEREHARVPELKREVERLTGQHTQAQLAVAEARVKHGEVVAEKTRLDARRKEYEDLSRRLAAAEGDLKGFRNQAAVLTGRAAGFQALLGCSAEIRARAQEHATVCAERDGMTARLFIIQTLEGERNTLQHRLQEVRHRLETDLQLVRQNVRRLRAKTEPLPQMERDVVDLERQIEALDRLRDEQETLRTQLQELAARRAEAQSEQRRYAEELKKSDERFRLLKGAQAVCPLCEEALPEEKRRDLGWRLREEKQTLKEAGLRAQKQEADAQTEEGQVRRRLHELEGKLKTGQLMRDRLAQARQTLLEMQRAAGELPDELVLAESLEKQLQRGDFAPDLQAELAELQVRIRSLDYSRERHEGLNRRAEELDGAHRQLLELEQAEAALPETLEELERVQSRIRVGEEALMDDRTAQAAAAQDLQRAPEVEAEFGDRTARMDAAEVKERAISRQLGAAHQALEQCEALAGQVAERKQERGEAAKEAALHEELAKAFGRNGIQALIIENAIPEIEDEANRLLGRMSDGQLAVRLKTQKELRSGAQGETLEIEISDAMGARRYEMYSGGEAFRVNFALRIALSKLLASRAGARLETLFIDEGFGSQDQEGRQRLVEAIQAVQDDFRRILVITHIDELKDMFPARIEVTKGPAGSQVAVY